MTKSRPDVERVEQGVITDIEIGYVVGDEQGVGVSFYLGGLGWGTTLTVGWDAGHTLLENSMREACVKLVDDLKGVPVNVFFRKNTVVGFNVHRTCILRCVKG